MNLYEQRQQRALNRFKYLHPDNQHPVLDCGLLSIHSDYIWLFASQFQGSSFSCYVWNPQTTAHRITVFKRNKSLTIQDA